MSVYQRVFLSIFLSNHCTVISRKKHVRNSISYSASSSTGEGLHVNIGYIGRHSKPRWSKFPIKSNNSAFISRENTLLATE